MPAIEVPSPNSTRPTGRTAGIILGIMFGMALVGALLALSTWKLRESRHPKLLPGLTERRNYAPADVPALGYLPADTNVAAGIHVADILRDKTGAKLLEPPLPGLLGQALGIVEQRTRIKLDAIDHVVLGTTLKDEVPQLTIVVQTRLPYSPAALGRLYPQKPIPQHKQPMFRIKLEPVGGGFLWCADPRTLVMILRPDAAKIEDMDRIPATPRTEGLPEPLRNVLKKCLRGCVLWVAGDLDDTRFLDLVAPFTHLPPKELELAKGIRSLAVGVLLQEDVTVIGALQARDNKMASEAKEYLEGLTWNGIRSKKVVAGPAKGPERNWVNFQVRAEPQRIREMLNGIYRRPK